MTSGLPLRPITQSNSTISSASSSFFKRRCRSCSFCLDRRGRIPSDHVLGRRRPRIRPTERYSMRVRAGLRASGRSFRRRSCECSDRKRGGVAEQRDRQQQRGRHQNLQHPYCETSCVGCIRADLGWLAIAYHPDAPVRTNRGEAYGVGNYRNDVYCRSKNAVTTECAVRCAISPTMPRRNSSTQTTKITPWMTVTHARSRRDSSASRR